LANPGDAVEGRSPLFFSICNTFWNISQWLQFDPYVLFLAMAAMFFHRRIYNSCSVKQIHTLTVELIIVSFIVMRHWWTLPFYSYWSLFKMIDYKQTSYRDGVFLSSRIRDWPFRDSGLKFYYIRDFWISKVFQFGTKSDLNSI
jgi:hypothetical protein